MLKGLLENKMEQNDSKLELINDEIQEMEDFNENSKTFLDKDKEQNIDKIIYDNHKIIKKNIKIKKKNSISKICIFCKVEIYDLKKILKFKSIIDFLSHCKLFFENIPEQDKNKYSISFYFYQKYCNERIKLINKSSDSSYKYMKSLCKNCFNNNMKEANGFIILLVALNYNIKINPQINVALINKKIDIPENKKILEENTHISQKEKKIESNYLKSHDYEKDNCKNNNVLDKDKYPLVDISNINKEISTNKNIEDKDKGSFEEESLSISRNRDLLLNCEISKQNNNTEIKLLSKKTERTKSNPLLGNQANLKKDETENSKSEKKFSTRIDNLNYLQTNLDEEILNYFKRNNSRGFKDLININNNSNKQFDIHNKNFNIVEVNLVRDKIIHYPKIENKDFYPIKNELVNCEVYSNETNYTYSVEDFKQLGFLLDHYIKKENTFNNEKNLKNNCNLLDKIKTDYELNNNGILNINMQELTHNSIIYFENYNQLRHKNIAIDYNTENFSPNKNEKKISSINLANTSLGSKQKINNLNNLKIINNLNNDENYANALKSDLNGKLLDSKIHPTVSDYIYPKNNMDKLDSIYSKINGEILQDYCNTVSKSNSDKINDKIILYSNDYKIDTELLKNQRKCKKGNDSINIQNKKINDVNHQPNYLHLNEIKNYRFNNEYFSRSPTCFLDSEINKDLNESNLRKNSIWVDSQFISSNNSNFNQFSDSEAQFNFLSDKHNLQYSPQFVDDISGINPIQ